ncbi:MAG: hypothetical protein P1V34_02590 [Alphaproteobacteria bacterium]|nr:hypothetical protein [Alphaproteobacteria bacterium]
MAIGLEDLSIVPARDAQRERLEYKLLYSVGYTAFLGAAIIARLMPWHWRTFGGRGQVRSVFEEARIRANGTVPFAFMR